MDAAVLVVVALAMALLSATVKVRGGSVLDYLAAGRRLSLPAFVASLVSTWYGGILGIGESVAFLGIGTWLLLGVPYYVFGVFYAWKLAPRVREAEQISIPERLHRSFGKGSALVGAALLFLLSVPAAHVLMLAVLAQSVLGGERWIMLVAVAAIGVALVARGGLPADVRIGMVAFVGMYVGFAVAVVSGISQVALSEAVARLSPEGQQLDGGQGFLAVLSFFVLGAWTLVDPGFHQRVASAESPRVGRQGVLVSVACWMVFDLLSISAAVLALATVRPAPADGLLLFPALAESALAPGLKGVFLAGIAGTVFSAFVGYTLVAGATVGREIVARLRPADDATVTRWTQWGMVASCGVAIALASSLNSVVSLWYAWAGAVVGALLLPVWLAYRPGPAVSGRVVAWSMALAFGVAALWLIAGYRTDNPFLEVVVNEQRFSLGTLVPGLAVSALVLASARFWPGRATDGLNEENTPP